VSADVGKRCPALPKGEADPLGKYLFESLQTSRRRAPVDVTTPDVAEILDKAGKYPGS
jgi:hypothetical protein